MHVDQWNASDLPLDWTTVWIACYTPDTCTASNRCVCEDESSGCQYAWILFGRSCIGMAYSVYASAHVWLNHRHKWTTDRIGCIGRGRFCLLVFSLVRQLFHGVVLDPVLELNEQQQQRNKNKSYITLPLNIEQWTTQQLKDPLT